MAKVLDGRALQPQSDRKTSLAKFSVRPQRLAFIIDKDIEQSQLLDIIEYNTWVWGGFYNILVPFRDGSIPDDYLRMIRTYDPDRLIFCGNIPDAYRTELAREIQPFNALNLSQFFPNRRDPRDFVNPICTPQLFSKEVARLKDDAQSNLRIPIVKDTHPLRYFLLAQAGRVDEKLSGFLTKELKAQEVPFDETQSPAEYLASLSDCLDLLYPIRLTTRHLSPTFTLSSSADAIVAFGTPGDVEALCMFWVWRMDASDGFIFPKHKSFTFLPPDLVKTKSGLQALADWLIDKRSHGNSITLIGPPALRRRLQSIQRRLLPLISASFRRIDVATAASFIPITKCSESEIIQEISWTDSETRFEVPKPSFDAEWLGKDEAWIVDCDFDDGSADTLNYFPPRYAGQLDLLESTTYGKWPPQSISGGPWRLSRNTVACKANMKGRLVRIKLPSSESIFGSVLRVQGFESNVSDKCGYIRATSDILRRSGHLKSLRDPRFRALLIEMAKGKALSLDQLQGKAKLGQDRELLRGFLLDLLSNAGVFRGVSYRCPECGLQIWYGVGSLQEILSCTGCSRTFQVPLDVEWSYVLSSLLRTTIDQGGIPVMLTEGVLKNLSGKTLYSVPGVVATDASGKEVDIDILASCDGHVVCVECKTLDNSPKLSNVREIVSQLEKDYAIAEQLGASVFGVALMAKKPPDQLKTFIQKKNRIKRGPLAIMIKLSDMERGYLCESCVKVPRPAANMDPPINIETLLHWGKRNGFTM